MHNRIVEVESGLVVMDDVDATDALILAELDAMYR